MLDRGDLCDLLVMDLAMPGLSGTETVCLARRTRPDLKALFCTGYADVSRFESETGRDLLLRKPFAPDALIEAVQRALSRSPSLGLGNVVPLRRAEHPKPADSAAARPGAHRCNRSNKSITANNATNHNIARLAHTTIFHGP